jgi:NCAIR mutase (PurE)-related protein
MGKLFHKLFLSCKEATLYMELKESNQLNLLQNIRLTIHLIICKYCKIYNKQREIISKIFTKKSIVLDDEVDLNQINQLKTKISDKLFKEN